MASLKEMCERLHIDWSESKMKKTLEAMPQVEKIKVKNRVFYRMKSNPSNDLFSHVEE